MNKLLLEEAATYQVNTFEAIDKVTKKATRETLAKILKSRRVMKPACFTSPTLFPPRPRVEPVFWRRVVSLRANGASDNSPQF